MLFLEMKPNAGFRLSVTSTTRRYWEQSPRCSPLNVGGSANRLGSPLSSSWYISGNLRENGIAPGHSATEVVPVFSGLAHRSCTSSTVFTVRLPMSPLDKIVRPSSYEGGSDQIDRKTKIETLTVTDATTSRLSRSIAPSTRPRLP